MRFQTPHLFGRVDYSGSHGLDPDGDTIHLFDPVILLADRIIRPDDGKLRVQMPGLRRPRVIRLKGRERPFVPVRFEGIDAPEQHYRASPFTLWKDGREIPISFDPAHPHEERSQPQWKPATDYAVRVLSDAGWALVELDREVVDRYGRVLGYVFASNQAADPGQFISYQLLRRGLAFPFLFESAGDYIPLFLDTADRARRAGLGVWRQFVDKPLPYARSFPRPRRYTDPEPSAQAAAPLNLPVVFRRVIDAYQLKGLSLRDALRKYDAIDYLTGDLVPGDRYHEIPIAWRIWAPHRYR